MWNHIVIREIVGRRISLQKKIQRSIIYTKQYSKHTLREYKHNQINIKNYERAPAVIIKTTTDLLIGVDSDIVKLLTKNMEDFTMDKTKLYRIIINNEKKSIQSTGLGRCRICGKRTPITAPLRYLLCQSCKHKGIMID